ncbi:MAG: hypothetical protein PWQ37_2034 [Candidatus Petromonas sp.]|nr:hypothetical protein [Candidatus Petromonas sp.]
MCSILTKKHYIIPIFVPHEGCPFDCVFCNQRKITGVETGLTGREVDEQIANYLKTIQYTKNNKVEIAFFGGSFTGISVEKQNEFLSIANKWYKKGIIDGIRLSTRPDYINKEILLNLKKYNVSIIELGVQSLDDEVLKKSCRGHLSIDVHRASSLIKDMGFKLGLQMMVGLPGDDLEKTINTARKIISFNPSFVRIYPTLVIKGTKLEELYLNGDYDPLSLSDAVEICKDLYKLFYQNDIDIIRIGLQPTDNIMEGRSVVAGPFHPAFRQLVESAIYKDSISIVLSQNTNKIDDIKFIVNPQNISPLVGDKKSNINYFKNKFNISRIKTLGDPNVAKDDVQIMINNEIQIITKKL